MPHPSEPGPNLRSTPWRRVWQGLRIALAVAILVGLTIKVRGDWPAVTSLTVRGTASDFIGAFACGLLGIFGLPLGFMVLL